MHEEDHEENHVAPAEPPVKGDIVYVRRVRPDEMSQLKLPDAPADGRLYAIHDVNGERLALTDNRALAFSIARRHDRTPVSVH